MKVTGYKLQAALKRAKSSKEIQNHLFNENLFQFEDANLDTLTVWEDWLKEEKRIVKLQVLQQAYNSLVQVNVMGEIISLTEAVKQLGVAIRAERIWKQAAKGSTYQTRSSRRWNETGQNKVREEGHQYAKPAFSVEACTEKAKAYGIVAGALKEAIQSGNAKELELAGATEDLFE